MSVVSELAVRITADLSDFNKEMQGLQSRLQPIGEKFKDFGKSATTYVTAPLTLAAGAMIKMASDAQEMQTKFDVVFANTGAGVTAKLDTFGKAVGRSVFELKGMASQLGDTLKPMGFAEDAAAGLAVDLTKLATDLSSFNNMPMDEALRRLQGTLVGSHENALAFGVVINENTLKAELHRMGMEDLTGAAKEQAKVQARINLLFAGTSDAQGDAERTAEGFANRLRALRASLSDVAIQMGEHILPFATQVIEKFRALITWVGDLSEKNQRLVLIIGAVAAAIGPLSIAIGFLITTISPWAVIIGAVIAAGTALVLNWDSIKAWVDANFPLISAAIGVAADIIVGLFENIWTVAKHSWDQIANYIATAVEVITGIAGVFFDVFTGNWSGAWDGVKNIFGSIWEGIVNAFSLALQAIKDVMPGFVQDWLGWTDDVSTDTSKITDALADTAVQVDETAKSFGSSSDIGQSLDQFTSQLNSSATPSVKTFTEAVENVQEPIQDVVADIDKVAPAATQMKGKLDPATVSLRDLGQAASDADEETGSFGETMQSFGAGFMDSIRGFESVFGDIGGRFGDLLDYGSQLTGTIIPGIKSMIEGLDTALGAFGINLERQFHSLAAFAGGYGNLLGLAGVAGVFFETGTRLFGEEEKPWERMGMSESEWREWYQNGLLATQGGRGFLGGVDLGATGLDWSYATGGIGGTGSMGRIVVNLDGQTIAEAALPFMEREIEINTR